MNDNISFRKSPVVIREGHGAEPYHMHRNAQELIWLLEGEAGITFNNKEYILNADDDLILLVDADFHKIRQISDHIRYLSFYIDLPYFERYIKDILHVGLYCNPGYRPPEQQPYLQEMRRLLAQMLWEYRSDESSRQVEELTTKLLLLLRNHFNFLGTKSIDYKEVHIFERMLKVYDFIYQHYTERVSLTDLARQINVSPAYLSRSVKQITGMGFKDILNYVRCEEAVRLLLETNKSITAIAYDCGFSDSKFFNHYFAKFFYGNPAEFRRTHRQTQETDFWGSHQVKVKYDAALEARLREYWDELDISGAGTVQLTYDASRVDNGRELAWETLTVLVTQQELAGHPDLLPLLQEIQRDIAPVRLAVAEGGRDGITADPINVAHALETGRVRLFCETGATGGLYTSGGVRMPLYYVLADTVPVRGVWTFREDCFTCRLADHRGMLLIGWGRPAVGAEFQINFKECDRRFLVLHHSFSMEPQRLLAQLTEAGVPLTREDRALWRLYAPDCATEIANSSEFGLKFKVRPACLDVLMIREL